MNENNGTPSRFTLHIARWIVAGSALLSGGCDEDSAVAQPETVALRSATSIPAIMDMSVADGHTWALLQDGTIKGWGEPYCEPSGCSTPAQIAALSFDSSAVELHAAAARVVTRLADGTVLTWTADITGTSAPTPVSFSHAEPVAQVALGEGFVCARFEDGRVDCQGLGSTPPPALAGTAIGSGAVALTAGASHACAVLDAGEVECWGNNAMGQLGASSAGDHHEVELSAPASSIVAGADHTCARLEGGDVQCWGLNDQGQLGHASAGADTVPLPDDTAQLVAGADHTCAILSSTRDLLCWGSDDLGQLGTGTTTGGLRRVDLDGLSASKVFSGPSARTTFARLDDGGLRGWGGNDVGQLGYGDDTDPLVEGLVVEQRTTLAVGKLPDIVIYDGEDD